MVYHRDQAQFDRARWRRAVLVPAWGLQVALYLTGMGLFSYRLAETVDNYKDEEEKGLFPIVEVVWECTNIGLSLLSLILTVVELAKFGSETLTPWTMLFTHVLKLVCAFAMLSLDIVVYVQRTDGHYSLVGLVLDCILIAVICVPAVYSIRTFRRVSKLDKYAYAANANAKPFGYRDDRERLQRNTSLSNRLSLAALSDQVERSLSSASRGKKDNAPQVTTTSLSSGSTPETETPTPTATAGATVIPLDDLGRSASTASSIYDHRRDTQFENYVAARQSLSLKTDIERAMGAEFGWVASPASAERDLARRDSVVGSGVVHSAKPAEGASTLGRAVSSSALRVLTAVPEMAEEVEEDRTRPSEEDDRRGLLQGQEVRAEDEPRAERYADGEEGVSASGQKRKWTNS